jgi:gamma-glutamylcyclotransferase (GGCT)/AIG2-like uncharacterized protein YtfP
MKKKTTSNALIFAYGSNMNRRQMSLRCPGAQVVSVARLPDHRLVFAGRSPRWGGGGVATIKPARRSTVMGVVWLLSGADLERLDGFEGYPYVYDRTPVLVDRDGGGKSLWCLTYVKNADEVKVPPTPEYLRTILDGYATAGAQVPVTLKRLYGQVSSHGLTA